MAALVASKHTLTSTQIRENTSQAISLRDKMSSWRLGGNFILVMESESASSSALLMDPLPSASAKVNKFAMISSVGALPLRVAAPDKPCKRSHNKR